MHRPASSTAALPVAILFALVGCVDPDLGDAPFLCHNGEPQCPEGYSCESVSGQDVCVKNGSQPPSLTDGFRPDLGTDGPAPSPDGPQPLPDGPQPTPDGPAPVPGTVKVTEFLADPAAVADSQGEWLELFNPGTQPVDINGWTLKDQDSDSHVISHTGPLVVPAKGYLLVGRSKDKVANGGVNVLYAYGSDFQLANTGDEVELVDPTGKVVDSFVYSTSAGFTIPTGASLSVTNPDVDKNNPANWCTETSPWAGSKGDKGTPGANPGC